MFKELINEDVNSLYIHIYKNLQSKNSEFNCNIDTGLLAKIKSLYTFSNKKDFVIYYRNNIYYSYELSNDNQSVFKSSIIDMKADKINDKYSLCYNTWKEQKLPCFIFPSTDDISYKSRYSLEESKINNRLSIFIKTYERERKQIVYLNYKHSPNADIDKIDNEILEILNRLFH